MVNHSVAGRTNKKFINTIISAEIIHQYAVKIGQKFPIFKDYHSADIPILHCSSLENGSPPRHIEQTYFTQLDMAH